ncbi:hypothetical protein DD238_004815 [Peronospora effusa]|uniref:Uncharacterized protein n=1 Tax=Peronospora effusa TaxID=542832 RepID=A0A3M6VMK0_9STRA|nr:hypothetical protein DD238_004815 [Peronospora effusa]RQM16333.1 hypothetical protein DD237_003890 [Peronospora effusa]
MKLSLVLLIAAGLVSTVSTADTTSGETVADTSEMMIAPSSTNNDNLSDKLVSDDNLSDTSMNDDTKSDTSTTKSDAPTTKSDTSTTKSDSSTTKSDASTTKSDASTTKSDTSTAQIAPGPDPFAKLKTIKHSSDSYHMPAVRVVHARVQSDDPELVDGVFTSSFGKGDLKAGYLSAMDTVNTASVEGSLMYVQAEGININVRAKEERCVRKSGMANIVFYEIIIVQTNETLAQFQETWGETPEYGPMLPMDSGRCTPLSGDDDFPPGCLQFNGDDDQPNVGPFVGAGTKVDDVRAPYPNNVWFSFASTCPLKTWSEKTDECRKKTRKGLCDYGEGPDGVDCTFAYNILGWVTIDDIVGITSIENPTTGSPYANFTEWCLANKSHTEFAANAETGEFEKGLPFWEDPLNTTANAARAKAVVTTYMSTLTSGSTQIDKDVISAFKALPTPEELAAVNPPCYMTVEACGSGNGCKRVGYSQLCTACEADEGCETGGKGFVYPKLEKAFTKLSDKETTTKLKDGSKPDGGTSADSKKSGAATHVSFTIASVAVGVLTAVFAL